MTSQSQDSFDIQPFDSPQRYELRVIGRLGPESAAWLDFLGGDALAPGPHRRRLRAKGANQRLTPVVAV